MRPYHAILGPKQTRTLNIQKYLQDEVLAFQTPVV